MKDLIEAVAIAAEICGTDFSPGAAKVFVMDLANYPRQPVLDALTRCRREVKGKLTLADVISRIDDGRPGAEEAWGMIPRDEESTVVMTGEMSTAFGACRELMGEDNIAARMVFKEVYGKAIQAARDQGLPVKWFASLGYRADQRAEVIEDAVAKKRLTVDQAIAVLPSDRHDRIKAIAQGKPVPAVPMTRVAVRHDGARSFAELADASIVSTVPKAIAA